VFPLGPILHGGWIGWRRLEAATASQEFADSADHPVNALAGLAELFVGMLVGLIGARTGFIGTHPGLIGTSAKFGHLLGEAGHATLGPELSISEIVNSTVAVRLCLAKFGHPLGEVRNATLGPELSRPFPPYAARC